MGQPDDEPGVLRAVDLAHPTRPDGRSDAIGTEHGAGGKHARTLPEGGGC